MIKISTKIAIGLLVLITLQSCSQAVQEQQASKSHGHSHGHKHTGAVDAVHEMEDAGFIKLKGMYFKMAADTETGGDTHLDLYFRDANGKHIPGAEIELVLTNPKQLSKDFTLNEGDNHYHIKTRLKDRGKYQAVAKVKHGGVSYNPRFAFDLGSTSL